LNGLVLGAQHHRVDRLWQPVIEGVRDSQVAQPRWGVGKDQQKLSIGELIDRGRFHEFSIRNAAGESRGFCHHSR